MTEFNRIKSALDDVHMLGYKLDELKADLRDLAATLGDDENLHEIEAERKAATAEIEKRTEQRRKRHEMVTALLVEALEPTARELPDGEDIIIRVGPDTLIMSAKGICRDDVPF